MEEQREEDVCGAVVEETTRSYLVSFVLFYDCVRDDMPTHYSAFVI